MQFIQAWWMLLWFQPAACWLPFVQTTPAPSYSEQSCLVTWGQSCSVSSVPTHRTLSKAKSSETFPKYDRVVAFPAENPSCLKRIRIKPKNGRFICCHRNTCRQQQHPCHPTHHHTLAHTVPGSCRWRHCQQRSYHQQVEFVHLPKL